MADKKTVGEAIQTMREGKGISRAKMAEMIGVGKEQLRTIERGQGSLTDEMAGKMSEALGIAVDNIVNGVIPEEVITRDTDTDDSVKDNSDDLVNYPDQAAEEGEPGEGEGEGEGDTDNDEGEGEGENGETSEGSTSSAGDDDNPNAMMAGAARMLRQGGDEDPRMAMLRRSREPKEDQGEDENGEGEEGDEDQAPPLPAARLPASPPPPADEDQFDDPDADEDDPAPGDAPPMPPPARVVGASSIVSKLNARVASAADTSVPLRATGFIDSNGTNWPDGVTIQDGEQVIVFTDLADSSGEAFLKSAVVPRPDLVINHEVWAMPHPFIVDGKAVVILYAHGVPVTINKGDVVAYRI